MIRFALSLAALIIVANPAQAKLFRNAYIAFEMPESWKCTLEVTEWVCRSESAKESKEAIIILTAKEVGPIDTYPLYEQHLNSPITTQTRGALSTSQVIYKAKTVNINDQPWLDGLHLASEVPNYFTRYLATIKDKISVLVTLSAHKNYYDHYSNEFFKTVMSLRVIATKDLLAKTETGSGVRGTGESLGFGSQGPLMGSEPIDEGFGEEKKKGGGKGMLILLALLLTGAGAFIYLRQRRK